MQIVIDIPNSLYANLQKIQRGSIASKRILDCVKNGIPLPKGHGRLIDADSMKTMKNIQSANFNAVELIRLWIDKQDTIIEADNSESEDK